MNLFDNKNGELEKTDNSLELLNTIQTKEELNYVFKDTTPENVVGGASHVYYIASVADSQGTPESDDFEASVLMEVQFQQGPRKEKSSIPGCLDVDLLEIVRDRLKGFQSGEFANEYNAKALQAVEEALNSLNQRIEDRINRGVLGTNNQ